MSNFLFQWVEAITCHLKIEKRQKVYTLLGNVLTSFEQYAQESKIRKNMNPEDFLRNAKQEFQSKASLESSSRI